MSEKKNRTSDMLQYIKPYMEECFQGACRIIQAEIEKNGLRIWDELKGIIREVLLLTDDAQRQGKKGNAEYLLFSFLGRSFIMDRLQIRIETFDDGFYLDKFETVGYYFPTFLQKRYEENLAYLHQELSRKFIRLQKYEVIVIKKEYTGYYSSILYRMIKSLTGLIMEEVIESKISITDCFKILYGGYMDRAIILYDRQKILDK